MIIIRIATSAEEAKRLYGWRRLVNYYYRRKHELSRYKFRFKHWRKGTKPKALKMYKEVSSIISSQFYFPNDIMNIPRKGL